MRESKRRDVPDTDAAAYYRELLKPVYRDKSFIVIGGPIVGLAGLAHSLKKLGANSLFLLGSSMGTGPTPDPKIAQWHSFDHQSSSVGEEFRRYEGSLRDLPDAARTALNRFDPEKRALGIGAIVLSDIPELDGRARYARRPPAWAALEDKTAIESFWQTVGIDTAPSRVIPIDETAFGNAFQKLDRGAGCAVAGDSRSQIHGGAEFTRWIRTQTDAAGALGFFAQHCDRIRVMPFLEGVPCSIHGIVLPDFVAVLRPVEMVVLRRPDTSAFVYTGVATAWDPPDRDRETMRAVARRTGETLREQVGYRGAFTIDGVLSEDGFLPTEINPRFGAGFGPISMAIPTLPLAALALAAAHGEALDYRGAWLESALVEAADELRFGRGSMPLPVERQETTYQRVVMQDGPARLAIDGEDGDGSFMFGPGPMGSFFNFSPDSAALTPGTFFAPTVVDAFALADREWKTAIGDVVAATELRRG